MNSSTNTDIANLIDNIMSSEIIPFTVDEFVSTLDNLVQSYEIELFINKLIEFKVIDTLSLELILSYQILFAYFSDIKTNNYEFYKIIYSGIVDLELKAIELISNYSLLKTIIEKIQSSSDIIQLKSILNDSEIQFLIDYTSLTKQLKYEYLNQLRILKLENTDNYILDHINNMVANIVGQSSIDNNGVDFYTLKMNIVNSIVINDSVESKSRQFVEIIESLLKSMPYMA